MKISDVITSITVCFIVALHPSLGIFHFHSANSLLRFAGENPQEPAQHVSSGSAQSHPMQRSADATPGFHRSVIRNGITLDLAISRLQPSKGNSLRPGDMRIRFRVHDAETGSPLTGLHPSAWMSLVHGNSDVSCKTVVKTFLGSSPLAQRPDVDMNGYYVAVLNQDASITIVDPQFASGKFRLVSAIKLDGRGQDWVLDANQTRIYVVIPEADEVAAIDTANWKIVGVAHIKQPGRLALQPDEHYLWVASEGTNSGVAVLRSDDLSLVKQIPLGKGPHDLAFTSDSRFAFATSKDAGAITFIDVPRLKVARELKTGGQPFQVAFSPIAQSAYAIDGERGLIFSISANRQEIVSQIHAESGLTQVSFPADGRLGFVLNPDRGKVHILDVARNQIVQTADIDKTPTEISFSDQLAYVVRRGTELIEMLPLDQLGKADTPVPVIDLPGSQSRAANDATDDFTNLVAQIPGQNSVVIASPKDKAVYYYDEGMAAPMGIFSNFGKEPRAVMVIDRSLREQQPGMYETSVRLEKPGTYTLPIVITSPPIVECFQVPVEPATSTH